MDARFLKHYNQELQHLREMGGEFAKQFPKIAGRLGLEGFECADPYVERLLEGFAFLAARVQLRIDAEFPRFTQHLLETVYPAYLAPLPSMAVVQFEPDPAEGSLAAGVSVPRHTILRSPLGKGDQTPCEYRTAHEVVLWPIEIAEAEYFRFGSAASADVPPREGVEAGLRLRLKATGGLRFEQMALDRLTLYLRGSEQVPMRLYEQLLGNAVGVVARPARRPAPWHEVLPGDAVRRVGFSDEEALLPPGPRWFSGYRLLHEYFAFPSRFLFVEIAGLQPAVRRGSGEPLDVLVLFDRFQPALENSVDASDFALFCSPAINLFPKSADRIHLSDRESEWHVVPDRTRPMDFEVYDVHEVLGYGEGGEREAHFLPFYSCADPERFGGQSSFFTLRRTPRLYSERQRVMGARSSYLGSETYIALVDGKEAPYGSDLKQLGVATWCTNRDLPLHMSVGAGRTDFNMVSGAPVRSVRCLAGPTRPRASLAEGETAWRLISHLAPNYLSLTDTDEKQGAAALREILSLYGDPGDAAVRKQVEGVKSVACRPLLRRVGSGGPVGYARGLEVKVTLDDTGFEGSGVFLLGAVLEQYFARYVSINSFTETVIRTLEREVMRWPARIGRRASV